MKLRYRLVSYFYIETQLPLLVQISDQYLVFNIYRKFSTFPADLRFYT